MHAVVCSSSNNIYLIVPDLNKSVVGARDQVWLVAAMVVVNTVDTFLVTFQREVG